MTACPRARMRVRAHVAANFGNFRPSSMAVGVALEIHCFNLRRTESAVFAEAIVGRRVDR